MLLNKIHCNLKINDYRCYIYFMIVSYYFATIKHND